MNLAAWAERNGVARVTAYRWFRAGLLPVPTKVGRLILVDEATAGTGVRRKSAVYARVCQLIRKPIWIAGWRGSPRGPRPSRSRSIRS